MPSAASCGPSGSLPGRLRAANGGMVSGFFDMFAWREPGQVGFYEAKIGPDRIKPAQLRFVELALRLHRLEEFMIVEVTGPLSRSAPAREPWKAADQGGGANGERQRYPTVMRVGCRPLAPADAHTRVPRGDRPLATVP